jgi:hypothetical protein
LDRVDLVWKSDPYILILNLSIKIAAVVLIGKLREKLQKLFVI